MQINTPILIKSKKPKKKKRKKKKLNEWINRTMLKNFDVEKKTKKNKKEAEK